MALVHAAAGGVGLFLCQWLKELGVTVIGTVGSDEKKDEILSNGANYIACSSYVWNNKKINPVSAIKNFK